MRRIALPALSLALSVAALDASVRAGDPPFRAVSFPASIAPIADGQTPLNEWGRELATDGTRVVIGARSMNFGGFTFADGVAEIWEFDDAPATRGWRRAADLLPPEGLVSQDQFGSAVAIEGDLAAVGAYRRKVGETVNAGTVYLYRRNTDGTWSHAQTLTSATPASNEHFGRAIAIEEGILLVGVPGRANGGGATLFVPDARGAYGAGVPFNVPGSVLSGDWGEVIALDGGVALVGDTEAKVGGIGVGALASFALNGATTPTFESFLAPPQSDIAIGALFGYYLGVDDGLLAVSSPNFNQGRGGVYTFRRERDTWVPGPIVYGPSPATRLGHIGVRQGLLALGVDGSGEEPAIGTSWLYRVDDRALVLLATKQGVDEISTFGTSVALLDDWWLVRDGSINGVEGSPWFVAQRLGDVTGDCDGNGIPNVIEVTVGGADDCDNDLVPTSCGLLLGDCDTNGELDACQTATVTVPSTTNPANEAYFYNFGAPLGILLSRVDVPVDATSVLAIGGLVSVTLNTSDVPSYIALYHDPIGADIPSNLTALGAWSTRFPMSNVPFEVALDPVPVVVGGAYYVAFATGPAGPLVAPLFASQGEPYIPLRSFFGTSSSTVFDPVEIGVSTVFVELADLSTLDLNLSAFARFATVEDANADGVPDVCACLADLDGDGAVGPKDLALLLGAWGSAGGDLSGDGTTDATDLGILLGGWGPCG